MVKRLVRGAVAVMIVAIPNGFLAQLYAGVYDGLASVPLSDFVVAHIAGYASGMVFMAAAFWPEIRRAEW
jgi:hypothetical protein